MIPNIPFRAKKVPRVPRVGGGDPDEDILTLMDYLWCQSFEEVEKNLSCFADVGLIDPDSLREGKIVSERLLENALIVGKKRAAGAKAIAKRWSKKE